MLSCWISVTSLLHCPLEKGLLSSSCNLHLGTCNRSFLRTENRSTINQFLLLLRTRYPLPPATVSHKPRSRIKSGMTVLLDCENVTSCHLNLFQHPGGFSEYVTYSHSELVSESRRFFLVIPNLSLGGEPFSDEPFCFALFYREPRYPRPRFIESLDPEQERFRMTK